MDENSNLLVEFGKNASPMIQLQIGKVIWNLQMIINLSTNVSVQINNI